MEKKSIQKLTDPLFLSFLGVVIVLGVLAWLKFSPQLKEKQNRPWLAGKIESVDKIEINHNNQKTVLAKKDGSWRVTSEQDLPADKEKINQLLTSLENLKKGELVSRNKNYHHKFGVDQEGAIELKVYQGENNLLHLLVGNAGPDFESDYIRFPDQKEVYLSNVALRSVLIQSRWKNLKITDFYSDQVEKIIIKKGRDQKEFDSAKAKELINQLTGIQANDAWVLKEEKKEEYGLTQPTATITIRLKEDKGEVNLKLGQKNKEDNLYCQKDDQSVVYLLPSWLGEKIIEQVENLLKV